jgi:chemotaxis response regulator CheB
MKSIRIDSSSLTILPVVKGLASEADEVTKAFEELRPEVIALSISREEMAGLRNREDYDKYEPSDLEIIYQAFLETFGEVRLPPPAYVRALDISEKNGVPIIPLDMSDEVYTEAYCENVSTGDMIKESFFARRATGKKFDLSSPQAFAVSWDKRVNKAKGFQALEKAREKHIANALSNLSKKYKIALALIEVERADGVIELLESR